MYIYYHNVTAADPNYSLLGYLSKDGDFISPADLEDYKNFEPTKNDPDFKPIVEIRCNAGLLSAGETYEEYCQRIAKLAKKHFDKLFKKF